MLRFPFPSPFSAVTKPGKNYFNISLFVWATPSTRALGSVPDRCISCHSVARVGPLQVTGFQAERDLLSPLQCHVIYYFSDLWNYVSSFGGHGKSSSKNKIILCHWLRWLFMGGQDHFLVKRKVAVGWNQNVWLGRGNVSFWYFSPKVINKSTIRSYRTEFISGGLHTDLQGKTKHAYFMRVLLFFWEVGAYWVFESEPS